MNPNLPITDADLHAWVDGQLDPERASAVEAHLATHPEAAARTRAWRDQKRALHDMFDPVQQEPVPARLLRATRPPAAWQARRLAAGLAIALIGGASGWLLRDGLDEPAAPIASRRAAPAEALQAADFARRAAVAHAVYSPEQRRPVEVDATHEDQLVAWLSKRMGAPMKPPHLQPLGYALEGGRLLPGGKGPVAQFMYRGAEGGRLTLYVTNEITSAGADAGPGTRPDTAFRFAREGEINVFYWVDGSFGYALSAQSDRAELARVSAEVYRQLASPAGR